VLSTSIDEDGRAKVVLGIDESDGEGEGANGRKRRRQRPAPVATADDECAVIGAVIPRGLPKPMVRPPMRPPMRPGMRPGIRPPMRPPAKAKPRAMMPKLNPFAKPLQISLEEDENAKAARIAARAARAEKAKEEADQRRKDKKKKKKRKRDSSSSSGGSDSERERHMQALFQLGRMPVGGGQVASDLCTGGIGMGPPPLSATMEAASAKIGVCTKFLMGDCTSGEMCNQKHPSDPADIARWIGYFNRQPCKHGNMCTIDKCLYDHPNRAGYNPTGTGLPLEPGKVASRDPRHLVGTSL